MELQSTRAKPHSILGNRFAEWYQKYPKHTGRAAAEKAYAKALAIILKRGDTEQVLFDGLDRSPRLKAEPQYIPSPAAWLNQGSYDDEPLPAGSNGSARQQEDWYKYVKKPEPGATPL